MGSDLRAQNGPDTQHNPAGSEHSASATQRGGDGRRVVAVVVTHRRLEQLRASLEVVCGQTRPIDHLVVVDNADEHAVRELVESQPVDQRIADAVGLPASDVATVRLDHR